MNEVVKTSKQTEQSSKRILASLSLKQKIDMMSGDLPFFKGLSALLEGDYYHTDNFPAGTQINDQIEGIKFIDGPRGVVIYGGATMFPVPMARGATFDPALEKRVGQAIGKEHAALGGNLFGGVCINLLRHPAWGRAQETYGEDTELLAQMGVALTEGVQQHVMACVKHFALNSMENARFKVDVSVSDRYLHELYLPHFKRVVDAGVASVMSAYNSVNGEWCGQNARLLRHILKQQWGFKGFVITDWVFGMRDAKKAALAGLDIEMPFHMHYARFLEDLVKTGEVPVSCIDESCLRILNEQQRQRQRTPASKEVLSCEAHTQLAREVTRRSVTLIKNARRDNEQASVLPLSDDDDIAVLGELADVPNIGDHGSSDGRPDYVVTVLEGLKKQSKGSLFHYPDLNSDEAKQCVKQVSTAVIVAGYTAEHEGEYIAPISFRPFADGIRPPGILNSLLKPKLLRPVWRNFISNKLARKDTEESDSEGAYANSESFGRGGDRKSLRLPPKQVELIKQAASLNNNIVVLLMCGSAILIDEWEDLVSSIAFIWYPGMEGGNGIADVVFGRCNPSGKLPFIIPTFDAHLPDFDAKATSVNYDGLHGYQKLLKEGNKPAYPFGYGLSYTAILWRQPKLLNGQVTAQDFVELSIEVENPSTTLHYETVFVFIRKAVRNDDDYPMQLKHFETCALQPESSNTIALKFPVSTIQFFDASSRAMQIASGQFEVAMMRHSHDETASWLPFTINNLQTEHTAI